MVPTAKFSGSSERKEGLVKDNDFVSLFLLFICLISVTGRPCDLLVNGKIKC